MIFFLTELVVGGLGLFFFHSDILQVILFWFQQKCSRVLEAYFLMFELIKGNSLINVIYRAEVKTSMLLYEYLSISNYIKAFLIMLFKRENYYIFIFYILSEICLLRNLIFIFSIWLLRPIGSAWLMNWCCWPQNATRIALLLGKYFTTPKCISLNY